MAKGKSKNWIKGAIKKPGSLRKALGAKPGKKIPSKKLNAAAMGKYGPKVEKKADLAKTLGRMSRKK